MKQFHFQADIRFEAEGLDDAYGRLAKHFIDLLLDTTGPDTEYLAHVGQMNLHLVEKCNKILFHPPVKEAE